MTHQTFHFWLQDEDDMTQMGDDMDDWMQVRLLSIPLMKSDCQGFNIVVCTGALDGGQSSLIFE